MSSNARECPHCGETDFFEPEMGWFSEPCRYEDSPRHALGCEGKGFLCRTEIMESYGIISLRDLRDMGVRDLSKYVCIREELYLSCDNAALREKIARAAAQNGLFGLFVVRRHAAQKIVAGAFGKIGILAGRTTRAAAPRRSGGFIHDGIRAVHDSSGFRRS